MFKSTGTYVVVLVTRGGGIQEQSGKSSRLGRSAKSRLILKCDTLSAVVSIVTHFQDEFGVAAAPDNFFYHVIDKPS